MYEIWGKRNPNIVAGDGSTLITRLVLVDRSRPRWRVGMEELQKKGWDLIRKLPSGMSELEALAEYERLLGDRREWVPAQIAGRSPIFRP